MCNHFFWCCSLFPAFPSSNLLWLSWSGLAVVIAPFRLCPFTGTCLTLGLNVFTLHVAIITDGTCLICFHQVITIIFTQVCDSHIETNTKENHKGDSTCKPDGIWFDDDETKISFIHCREKGWICNACHVNCQCKQIDNHKNYEKLLRRRENISTVKLLDEWG